MIKRSIQLERPFNKIQDTETLANTTKKDYGTLRPGDIEASDIEATTLRPGDIEARRH